MKKRAEPNTANLGLRGCGGNAARVSSGKARTLLVERAQAGDRHALEEIFRSLATYGSPENFVTLVPAVLHHNDPAS